MNSNYACRSSYNIDFLNKSNRSKYYFVGRNNTKEKNIRCPVCQNECFYSYTHHVVTYSNSGNVGKTKAAIKVAVKSALVPKVGRLLKGLSCSHCSNVLNFRNYNSIRKVKNSNKTNLKNKNSNKNRV